MIVCPRCKSENDDGRIRCAKCGNNISKRGEYSQQQGPKVVVLGSVEDLRRAREQGEVDDSGDDATALGWLDDSVDVASKDQPAAPSQPSTRRISVREIDKISGLKDLKDIQKALLGKPEEPQPPTRKFKIERGSPRGGATETPAAAEAHAPSYAPEPEKAPPPPPPPPPPAEKAANVAAWLVCELFMEAFPLALGQRYLLGRDRRAPICLPSSEVSRSHAGISTDEQGSFWIEDLKSMNGTYVNGHAVLKRKLRAGDVIDVGPFSFTFSLASPDAPAPKGGCDPNQETRAMRAFPGALTGEIDKNGVRAVLKLLHASKRSGVLTLRAGRQVGRVFVVEGEIHHATFGKATGDQALAALVPAEAGLFHFADEKVKVKRTIERSTDEILG